MSPRFAFNESFLVFKCDVQPGVYIVEGRGSNVEDVGLLLLARIALSMGFVTHINNCFCDFGHNLKESFSLVILGEAYFHL